MIADMEFDKEIRERVDNKIKIAEIINRLTKEQLEAFENGISYNSDKLKDNTSQMVDAVRREIEMENNQGNFEVDVARRIIDESNNFRNNITSYSNWYKKIKY